MSKNSLLNIHTIKNGLHHMKARAHDPDANHWPAEPSIRQTSEAYSKQVFPGVQMMSSPFSLPRKAKMSMGSAKVRRSPRDPRP